jgi:hypothetical protein
MLTSLTSLDEEEEEVNTRASKRRQVARSSKDLLTAEVPEGSKDNRRRRPKPQPSDVAPVKPSIKPHSSSGKRVSAKAAKNAV